MASTTLGLTRSSPRSWFSPRVTRWPYSLSLSRMNPSASRNWTSTSTWNGSRRRDSTVAIHAIRAKTSFRSVTRVRHPVTSQPSCAAAPVTATASTAADSSAVRLARSSARPCSIPAAPPSSTHSSVHSRALCVPQASAATRIPRPGNLAATTPVPSTTGTTGTPASTPRRRARNHSRAARDPARGVLDSTRYGVELHLFAFAPLTHTAFYYDQNVEVAVTALLEAAAFDDDAPEEANRPADTSRPVPLLDELSALGDPCLRR